MSQNSFQFRYQEMRDNNPGKSQPERMSGEDNDLFYPSGGGVRNVCFILPDGRHVFLNYAYLVSGEYNPDESMILLAFTTHTVLLKGVHLGELFEQFMAQLNRIVACVDERYNQLQANSPTINHITISNN